MKAIAGTMALQEEGQPLTVFRMTPHRKLAEDIKKGSTGANGQSLADYIRRRIVRHVENEVGRVPEGLTPEVIVITEISPAGTFHCHAPVTRQDSRSLRKALRLAGFERKESRQFQVGGVVTGEEVTPGWAPYAILELCKSFAHISMSQSTAKKGRSFYNTFQSQCLQLLGKAVSQK